MSVTSLVCLSGDPWLPATIRSSAPSVWYQAGQHLWYTGVWWHAVVLELSCDAKCIRGSLLYLTLELSIQFAWLKLLLSLLEKPQALTCISFSPSIFAAAQMQWPGKKINPNTKRCKQTLFYFNTNTQYAPFRGNPLYQATKRHLNNRETVKNDAKWKKKTYLVMVEFLQLVQCLEDCWHDNDLE